MPILSISEPHLSDNKLILVFLRGCHFPTVVIRVCISIHTDNHNLCQTSFNKEIQHITIITVTLLAA